MLLVLIKPSQPNQLTKSTILITHPEALILASEVQVK